jgi:ferritin-like metal-binding protein YciE
MIDRNTMIAWLNDSYAMENALMPILQNHAADASFDPASRERIELHLEQTRRHAELVRGCVERLGSTTSVTKTGLASLFGTLQSVTTAFFSDEVIKNGLSDYATEHFEIACYRALQAAAESMGDTHIAEVCGAILRDEEEMAHWLEMQIPKLVREVGSRKPA